MNLHALLQVACRLGASDLHLTVNSVPVVRINGRLYPLDDSDLEQCNISRKWHHKLSPEDTMSLARKTMNETQIKRFMDTGECDLSFSVAGTGRFRINVFKQCGSAGMAIRPVNMKIPTLHELGLPVGVSRFVKLQRGLVLVTGPTGSGKSTTLAAMIDLLNRTERKHIVTIEDPIEYVHHHRLCLINQREIGQDTMSFGAALRAAMREDPDVILVGEMRDLETIGAAITAAETGHLVLATLHTSNAPQTVDRIIDVFPPYQQQQIRVQLANVLQGVVAQKLLPRRDCPGRIAAVELMFTTPAIRNLIRENKTFQIVSQMQTGGRFGMQTMERAIIDFYKRGIISREDAVEAAADPDGLAKLL